MESKNIQINQLKQELENKETMIQLLRENIEVLENNMKIIEDNYVLTTGMPLFKNKHLKIIR